MPVFTECQNSHFSPKYGQKTLKNGPFLGLVLVSEAISQRWLKGNGWYFHILCNRLLAWCPLLQNVKIPIFTKIWPKNWKMTFFIDWPCPVGNTYLLDTCSNVYHLFLCCNLGYIVWSVFGSCWITKIRIKGWLCAVHGLHMQFINRELTLKFYSR